MSIHTFRIEHLPCAVKRTRRSLRGWVELPPGHPWHRNLDLVRSFQEESPLIVYAYATKAGGWVLGFDLPDHLSDAVAIAGTASLACDALEAARLDRELN